MSSAHQNRRTLLHCSMVGLPGSPAIAGRQDGPLISGDPAVGSVQETYDVQVIATGRSCMTGPY